MLAAAEMCNANGNWANSMHARNLEHMNLSEKSQVKRGKKLPKRHRSTTVFLERNSGIDWHCSRWNNLTSQTVRQVKFPAPVQAIPSNCGKQTAVAPEKQCLLQGLSVVPAMQMFGIHSRKQNSRTQANHSGIQAGPGVRSLPRLNHLTFQGDVPTAHCTSAHIKSAPQLPEALEEEAPRPSAKMESSSLAPSGLS